MGTPLQIVPYNPLWPHLFAEIESKLHDLLLGSVNTIDHVGSTAVPGLAAKPYIDVDVMLKDIVHMERCRVLMENSGYEPRGSRYGDGVWAFMIHASLTGGQRVYLCPPDSDTHRKRLRFRDILRKDRSIADAYSAFKHELAYRYRDDGDSYTRAKASFIENALKN